MSNVSRVVIKRSGLPDRVSNLCNVRRADSFLTRLVGLLSRRSLGDEEGLIIVPCASVHTFWMRFSIDLVFLDRQHRVLGISENVKPNRVRVAPNGTFAVLEIAQGNVMRTGIHLDDILIFD